MPPLTEEQHRIRATGIGSSDLSAVCGENPFKTRHAVWLDKMGLVEREPESDATWLGRELEPILAKRYAEEMGVEIVPGPGTVRHPELPWLLATTDYEHADGSTVVECKVVGWRVEHHWDDSTEDGIPAYVAIQCQEQMAVRGISEFAVPVLFTSDARFRIFRAHYDERIASALIEIGRRFWFDNVLARTPPPVDGSDDAREILTWLYPRNIRNFSPAPVGAYAQACLYLDAKDAEKRAKADASLAGNKLRKMIGDAEGIEADWGRVTWRSNKNDQRSLRVTMKNREAA